MGEAADEGASDNRTRSLGSLAATIELSLASPMFQELGPDAREVLEVVAFFPQGANEDNVEGLFPTIFDGPSMFDTFCNLFLTYRSDGFITMLAPLRDHLRPKDPMASPLLRTAKEHYFKRLPVDIGPGLPGFNEPKRIMSEDVNVEHLLDVFTSIDVDSNSVWGSCYHFMEHLYWHKPRLVIIGPKVEALPDSHPSKPHSLFFLSRLFDRVGNSAERKRILLQSLGLWRKRGHGYWIADTLIELADANRETGLYKKGIQQAIEALEIYVQIGKKEKQAHCYMVLAYLLLKGEHLDAAEESATRAINHSQDHDQHTLCQTHHVLGQIHETSSITEEAIHHLEASIRIASPLGDSSLLSEAHLSLARLYFDKGKFDDMHTHVEHANSHVRNSALLLGRVFMMVLARCTGIGCLGRRNRRGCALLPYLRKSGPWTSRRRLGKSWNMSRK